MPNFLKHKKSPVAFSTPNNKYIRTTNVNKIICELIMSIAP